MKENRSLPSRARRGGVTRAAAVLLALIAVMLVIVAIPVWKSYSLRAEKLACEQALKSARDGLIIEFLGRWDAGSPEEARQTLDQVLPERPNICPSGGTIYLIRRPDGIFEPICGLHDSDAKLRARLNASRALELLRENLRQVRRYSDGEPESVSIRLNGRTLECVRVASEPELRRGTRTTRGFEGTVAFYALAGEGDFAPKGVKNGEICYFLYADEDNNAVWRADGQWQGTAYEGMEEQAVSREE